MLWLLIACRVFFRIIVIDWLICVFWEDGLDFFTRTGWLVMGLAGVFTVDFYYLLDSRY